MIIHNPRHPNGAGVLRASRDDDRSGRGTPYIQPKIGLALSGGGARGLAHVGVLQVLEENKIPITAIAGTSMGAYVGAVYAAGLGGPELEKLAREIKDRRTLMSLLDWVVPPSSGLIRGDKIRKHLERTLGTRTFADLKLPLLIIATDLDTLDAHIFDSGLVTEAVHASAAIPGICTPVCLNGRRFTDGGAAEPLPVSVLRERFNLNAVIAVNVLPTAEDIARCRDASFTTLKKRPGLIPRLLNPINLMAYGNVMDTFRRALMCAQVRLVEKEGRRADVLIHPFDCGSTWLDFEHFDRYIATGRRAAEAALPAIRALLSNPNPTDHETALHHSSVGCLAA